MRKVLIANRGEIALRIIRSARKLGISTVAIHSKEDSFHPHVKAADEAFCIEKSSALDSYLCAEEIISVALVSGAEAIHPGYGFLSENPDFVEQTEKSGLIFIGPSAKAMRLLGHKDSARKLAKKTGVPLIPGYHGKSQEIERLTQEANKIGTPLIIKARAGGGGRGTRRVEDLSDLERSLDATKREAMAYFNDDALILEKAINPARHVEIQVLSDNFGNAVHLFERDCSLQRRLQKVIEETPSPGLSNSLRSKLCDAALLLVKSSSYTSAVTIEFLVPVNETEFEHPFFFLEANCRIQVEHPVTEMLTGLDIVELQFQIARGEQLPVSQIDIKQDGAVVEARVYAEAPWQQFLPKTGEITDLSLPECIDPSKLRFDHALSVGQDITTNYDPLLMKVIARGENRAAAHSQLRQALLNTCIFGIDHNISFMLNLLEHKDVIRGAVDTRFIDTHIKNLLIQHRTDSVIHAVLCYYLAQIVMHFSKQLECKSSKCPFDNLVYWRIASSKSLGFIELLNPVLSYSVTDTSNNEISTLRARISKYCLSKSSCVEFEAEVNDAKCDVRIQKTDTASRQICFKVNGLSYSAHIPVSAIASNMGELREMQIHVKGQTYVVERLKRKRAEISDNFSSYTGVTAPLPGTIVSISVSSGQQVKRGDGLAIIESMKMEHTLSALADAKIKEVLVTPGTSVKEGQEIILFE